MSERFPGGIISKTAPVPTGPYENGTAPGIWTLEQQAEFVKQGIWPIAGNVPNYIEDVFSTWLWTTSGSNQTFTTGIDMTKGALTWIKGRSNAISHVLQTGVGGGVLPNNALSSNNTNAYFGGNYRIADSTTGFTMGTDYYTGTPETAVVWTFREQPKFFDVVTYTGNGGASQTINHNLGSVPGCMIIKRTDQVTNWEVYHRSLGATKFIWLNSTAGEQTSTARWNDTNPTSTQFTVGSSDNVNASGGTYVAYLFAHNAGGFGLTGTDNVISCGSYTGNGSSTGPEVNIGYEPQWLLIKEATQSGNSWSLYDNMRGLSVAGPSGHLRPNDSAAEDTTTIDMRPTATGFQPISSSGRVNRSGETFIYIAIRRGPMKTPTTGTSVFAPALASSSGTYTATSNFPVDWAIEGDRASTTKFFAGTRLIGDATLQPNTTGAESAQSWGFANMTGFTLPGVVGNYSGFINWMMRRAPGFFDVVCYTGTGATNARTHNLTVAPELIICKSRSGVDDWSAMTLFGASTFRNGYLNTTLALPSKSYASNAELTTQPTATTFTLGTGGPNASGSTYVAYLFASCPGVSKVGSFTGTGATQVIDCGFTSGARFVLIKATSTTGDWYVWDSARGIVAGNDPYLALNSTAAEVTNTDWVDTAASGFELSNAAGNLANSNGVSYIFLAIS